MGKRSGPNSTMAGMPSSTLPSTMKQTMEIARNPQLPPGMLVIALARSDEKPDCVSPQAMPVAQPTISMIAPDSEAVSTSMGLRRRQSKQR